MVSLQTLTKEDLPFLLEVRNDKSTRKYLENNSIFTLEQCKLWFERLSHPWFIVVNEQGEKVGYFRTNHFNEVGCDIHPNHRRKGYARQAYQEYLKDKTEAKLWVFYNNFARKLYEDLGFTYDGLHKRIRGEDYIHMIWKK